MQGYFLCSSDPQMLTALFKGAAGFGMAQRMCLELSIVLQRSTLVWHGFCWPPRKKGFWVPARQSSSGVQNFAFGVLFKGQCHWQEVFQGSLEATGKVNFPSALNLWNTLQFECACLQVCNTVHLNLTLTCSQQHWLAPATCATYIVSTTVDCTMALGENTLRIIKLLDNAAKNGEKTCPVCYHTYLRKFLTKKDRWNLFQTSWDCGCDYVGGEVPKRKNKGPRFTVADLREKMRNDSDSDWTLI